jgi:uncharacterized membrane protein YccC
MTAPAQRARAAAGGRGLTDDVLTLGPRAVSMRAYLRDSIDQLAGADPAFTQLRLASQAVLGMALGLGLAYVFVRATGALQMPDAAGPPAVVRAGDHALLIVALLVTGIVAITAGLQVTDATAVGQIQSSLLLPLPLLASMAVGLAIGSYRVASLIWLIVLLAVAVYLRRFGSRGVTVGIVLFNGGFLGVFLHAQIRLADLGRIAVLIGLGVTASLVVRFAFFRPNLIATLARMRRSWEARANRLLVLSIAVLDAPDSPHLRSASRRLARQLVRLNESTLMIDAQLAESVPDSSDFEAQRLFNADLALSNIARFADALAGQCRDRSLRARARACIAAVLAGDKDGVDAGAAELRRASRDNVRMTVVGLRLAASAQTYMAARRQIRATIEHVGTKVAAPYTPAVALSSGWLPGSGPVSTEASTTPGRGGSLDRAALQPHTRVAVQATVAGTIAIVVGDIVSGPRLYWAVLVTFLAFTSTANSGEQIRKALFRVTGTAIGIVVGDLLVHLTGGRVWSSLLIVIVSLFFGIYLNRINYTFMAIAITVTVSQIYAQLGELSWHLLLLRLGETAIGVGAVVVTVLFVLPLRPQRVLTTGVLLWFRSLSALVNDALDHMLDKSHPPIRADMRAVDAAYAALESTAAPLRQATFGRNSAQLTEIRAVCSAARNYARSFANAVDHTHFRHGPPLTAAANQLRNSMAAIDKRIATGEHGTYTRSAALFEMANRAGPVDILLPNLAINDLTLLDGALATLAYALGMTVVDHDTTPPDPIVRGGPVSARDVEPLRPPV